MSNVLFRNRSLSDLEFMKNAVEIRAIFIRYLMNEKKVPKRWRPVFTFPGTALAIKLMEEITAANTIYVTTEAELEQRRYHQNEAIIACEQIIQHIQLMIETLDECKVSDFEILGELLIKETALLKGWRKANKIFPKEDDIDDESDLSKDILDSIDTIINSFKKLKGYMRHQISTDTQ